MKRRQFLVLVPAATALLANGSTSIRGRLAKSAAGKPVLETDGRKPIPLIGDADTEVVLDDDRLVGADFEVVGAFENGVFRIDPIHTAAFFVHKDGKRYRVTYWCDVCAIRTYTPGLCQCCREETVLDLREADKVDTK